VSGGPAGPAAGGSGAGELQRSLELRHAVELLCARYVHAIDDDRLEEWPDFFTERCLYRITSAENHDQGLPINLFFADTQAMLRDRVTALRRANIYEAQRYRHAVSALLIGEEADGLVRAQSNFQVVRTLHNGSVHLFATGRYLDRISRAEGTLRFTERLVVCDSNRIDTLLAIPL
jgi:3-phenylpropionate/cinnamic acid dioxygenase small subunit